MAKRKLTSLRTVLLRYLLLCGCGCALILVLWWIIFMQLINIGFLLPAVASAQACSEARETVAAVTAETFDSNQISDLCRWAVVQNDTVLQTNMTARQLKIALNAFHGGSGNLGYTQYQYDVKMADGSFCLLQYDYAVPYADPALRNTLPDFQTCYLLLLALLTARDENGFCYLDAEGLRGSTLFWGAKLVGLAYLAAAFLRCSWTLSNWKQETPKEELKTLLLLALAPAAGFLLQGWLPGRGLLCCGITLGLVCVYVLVLQTKFTVDTLTGVSNRIVALRYLESELPYYRRHPNRSLHFLMMDMDHFKHINDEYGHLEGDAALVLLAGILKKVCANYNGVLARYGGDEFCIACGCNSVEVRTLIASIQRELDAANAASGKPYQIEISIGCARLEPDIATVHDLIDKADQEMYHLKTRKRGIS